jgi:hypothetical protein
VRVRQVALGATVLTGAATLAYRLGRPLLRRIGAAVRRRKEGPPPPEPVRLTPEKYAQLHDGMSAAAVVRLLGPEFREVNRTAILGAHTRTLVWTTTDGRVLHAVLQNDRLVAKAQRGLE